MSNRLAFRKRLQNVGVPNLYFQPPETKKLKYPCCIYSMLDADIKHADGAPYVISPIYEVILIDQDPDTQFLYPLMEMSGGRFTRFYTSDNLNHWVFRFYETGTHPEQTS